MSTFELRRSGLSMADFPFSGRQQADYGSVFGARPGDPGNGLFPAQYVQHPVELLRSTFASFQVGSLEGKLGADLITDVGNHVGWLYGFNALKVHCSTARLGVSLLLEAALWQCRFSSPVAGTRRVKQK